MKSMPDILDYVYDELQYTEDYDPPVNGIDEIQNALKTFVKANDHISWYTESTNVAVLLIPYKEYYNEY